MTEQLNLIPGLAEGRRGRDEGVTRVSANPANDEWRDRAALVLSDLIAAGRAFSAADLIDRTGMPPTPNAVGALFIGARRAGRIRPTGRYVQARRAVSHARRMAEWVPTTSNERS